MLPMSSMIRAVAKAEGRAAGMDAFFAPEYLPPKGKVYTPPLEGHIVEATDKGSQTFHKMACAVWDNMAQPQSALYDAPELIDC